MALLSRKQHVPSFGATETAGHSESIDQKAEIEEAQLYVSLLQICLEAKIPMQYIEMYVLFLGFFCALLIFLHL